MAATRADRAGRLVWFVALAGCAAAVVGAIGVVLVRAVDPAPFIPDAFGFGPAALVGFETMGLAFASVGGIIVVRRPKNAIGWLMILVGVGYADGGLAAVLTYSFAASDSETLRNLTSYMAWVAVAFTTVGSAIFAIGFIFPTGRGHTPAWDRFVRMILVGWPIGLLMILIQPGALNIFPTINNPFGIGPNLESILGVRYSSSVAAATVVLLPVLGWSLASRYRRVGDVERHQLKWFGLALVVALAGVAVSGVWAFLADHPPELGLATYSFAGTLVALAIGIAITRYHLYDIDHIISRTLAYGIVSVILVAVFASVNLGLAAAIGGLSRNSPIVVAVSTLSVAALFQPVRRRVQAIVDRRFHRARYDAERTVDHFVARMRDEVDLGMVNRELLATADDTVHPVAASVWLRIRPAA